MARRSSNWLQAPGRDPWYAHALENALSGYKAGREPARMRAEEEKAALANRLLQAQGQHAEDVNKYYGPGQEQALEKGGIENKTAQMNFEELPDQLARNRLKEQLANQTAEKNLGWIDQEKQALIDQRKAAAEKSGRGPEVKPTKQMQNLMAMGIYPGDPRFDEAMRLQLGLPAGRKVPAGTRPFEDMPTNERLDASKRMRNVVKSYANVKQVQNNIISMRDIINKNPHIAGSLGALFIDPNDPGVKSLLASWLTSEKDKTAIQKMKKLASDINLQELSSFGNAVSDARQSLIAETKANPNLTKESILYILDKLEKQKEPYERFYNATKKGLSGNYEVYDDPEAYRLENMTPEMLAEYKAELQEKEKNKK
jgi:hypothetical protein